MSRVVENAGDSREKVDAGVPSTMRAVVARRYGSPDVVAVEEVATPSPGPGEVLVRVEASSLNALDWHYLTGTPYFMRLMSGLRRPKRTIFGADVAGSIVSVGAAVSGLEPGDAVFGQCGSGGCAEYVAVKAENLVRKPGPVSFNAAAATPVAALTALQGLRTHGKVERGERVLVNGAAGGVGTFAVQIAVALGAEVTAVCSTRNTEMVRGLGAVEVIDYTVDDFVDCGRHFDVMFDNVGNRSAADCLKVLRSGARYIAITGPTKNQWIDPLPHLARKTLAMWRSSASFHQFTESPNETDLAFLAELLDAGTVTPVIDRVIGLDAVADGLRELMTGHARAKIVVVPS